MPMAFWTFIRGFELIEDTSLVTVKGEERKRLDFRLTLDAARIWHSAEPKRKKRASVDPLPPGLRTWPRNISADVCRQTGRPDRPRLAGLPSRRECRSPLPAFARLRRAALHPRCLASEVGVGRPSHCTGACGECVLFLPGWGCGRFRSRACAQVIALEAREGAEAGSRPLSRAIAWPPPNSLLTT